MSSALPKWTTHLSSEMQKKGVSLSSLGVMETAWPVDSFEEIVRSALSARFAVLGGDILTCAGDSFRYTYNSWSASVLGGESWPEYVTRSCADAQRYLAKLRGRSDLWFTLVAADKPNAKQLVEGYDR
jgi:Immunity protein 40